MVIEIIEELRQLRAEFENLDRTFTTRIEVKIPIEQIKKELTEELKRELQGRSSYGTGI